MTNLKRPEKVVEVDGVRFVLRRPGRGGIGRIARRLATLSQDALGNIDGPLLALDGAGIQMEAVLHEYLIDGPDEWRDKDAPKQPAWDFDDADAELFAEVGEAAVDFHESFLETDDRFSGGRRERADGEAGVAPADGVPEPAGS